VDLEIGRSVTIKVEMERMIGDNVMVRWRVDNLSYAGPRHR
jgi:hypothetical protein